MMSQPLSVWAAELPSSRAQQQAVSENKRMARTITVANVWINNILKG